MRVVQGRERELAADHEVSDRMLAHTAATGEPAVRVWIPHRQVAFGRRDRSLEGYDCARAAARETGFPPVERRVGGRAVGFDGETTVAFARTEPVVDVRTGIGDRYERLTAALERALTDLGVGTVRGEPPDSFCPGSHSLSSASNPADRPAKIAGIAQRVRADAALVAGVLVVERRPLVDVLEAVYGALEVPLDPDAVGSVAAAGGPSEPEPILQALTEELIGQTLEEEVETIGESSAEVVAVGDVDGLDGV